MGIWLGLLREILRDDDGGAVERRLRVVAIYTGEPRLPQIYEETRATVSEALPDDHMDEDGENELQFSCGAVRVAVLAKEHSVAHARYHVPIAELPDRLAEEFTRHSRGLVASAALSALTGVRADAHRLLTALGPELDPALLGRRIALDVPADVERQVEELVSAEIGAIVADHEVGRFVRLSHIKDWLDAQQSLPSGGLDEDVTEEQRLAFLRAGLGEAQLAQHLGPRRVTKGSLRRIAASGTRLFVTDPKQAENSDHTYFERMVLATRYSRPRPILRLGTIISHGGTYALCVQPLCDSERLRGITAFPFLMLETRDLDGLFRIGLRDPRQDNRWVELGIDAVPGRIRYMRFEPGPGRVVNGNGRERVRFAALDRRGRHRGPRYRHWTWVADLKPDQAQRAVSELARSFSRQALTEPEGLRRRSN